MRAVASLLSMIALGCGGRPSPQTPSVAGDASGPASPEVAADEVMPDDVAPSGGDGDAPRPIPIAPTTADDAAATTPDAASAVPDAAGAGADVSAVAGDVAAEVVGDGSGESAGDAGAWLPAEVRGRLDGGNGCVAVSASGRVVLSIVGGASGPLLRLVDFSWDRGGDAEMSWPLDERARAYADPYFDAALRGAKLSPCETFDHAPPVTLRANVPIAISADEERAELAIEGNRPVRVSLDHGQWRVAGVYYLRAGGPLYLRLARATGEREPDDFRLVNVGAVELGQSRCVPRPRANKPADGEPPPFEPAPREVSCVAMSADGTKAAFKTWYKGRGGARKDAPNAIEWFGPGPTPAVDLGCMARRCKVDELERVRAAAAAAGLVGCAPVKGAIALDGGLAPFVVAKELVRLQGGSGWRTVFELVDGPGVHETLWKAFQRPRGGPVYLYLGRDDGEGAGEGPVVRVLDEAGLGLCDPPPADALAVTEVVVSGALKDRSGYKLGGSQLVDGDPTTAWQPQPPVKGESAWAELVLDGEREVSAIEIANGFQRLDGNGDLFALNGRVAELVIAFPDGTSEKVTLAPDERGFRRIGFSPRRAARVRLLIAGVHASDGPVAISEARVIGR